MRIYSTSESPESEPAGDTYMGISLADASVDVRRYGQRTWGVYFGDRLLCVTVYLKGAIAVQQLIEQLQGELRRVMSKGSSLPLASDPPAAYGESIGTAS